MLTDLLPFVAAALLVILFPGPDFTLVVRNAAAGGQRGARATIAGILVGNVVLATLAVLGLTALLSRSEAAYTVLKLVGGCYLLWLGVGALRDWWSLGRTRADRDDPTMPSPADATPAPAAAVGGQRMLSRRAFRQGLVSNLFNPKVALFYLSLFPQFHVGSLGPTAGAAVLASTFVLLAAVYYAIIQAAVGTVESFLARRRTRRTLAGGSGVALTALSVVLLADR